MSTDVRYAEADQIQQLITTAASIVVMQADNPDADSLGSALALEHILGDMGKQVSLYCGVRIPEYLAYLPGYDRVSNVFPIDCDLSIIVDTSANTLFGILNASPEHAIVSRKPCIVLDHHATEPSIQYATVTCISSAVATGELIYELCQQLKWPLSTEAARLLTSSIMSDSLGLTSEGTSARSIHIVGEMVEQGVSLSELEHARRLLMRKSPELLAYKAQLLSRIQYFAHGRIAIVTIPWAEIATYSHAYNPSMLVIDEMRQVNSVDVAIAFKQYADGKITAKIRCNYGIGIAATLAEHFGGGGHKYASGFKTISGKPLDTVVADCIRFSEHLLDLSSEQKETHETVQHAYSTD